MHACKAFMQWDIENSEYDVVLPEIVYIESMYQQIPESAETGQDRLTLDETTVAALWSKTYNPEGKPDWSHLF
ncbi:MAG: hypothetical protein QHH01_01215, partial [Spirochaetales bacterium]|nr:hypothetical protein [Spirochaetales bacterium]